MYAKRHGSIHLLPLANFTSGYCELETYTDRAQKYACIRGHLFFDAHWIRECFAEGLDTPAIVLIYVWGMLRVTSDLVGQAVQEHQLRLRAVRQAFPKPSWVGGTLNRRSCKEC